MKAYFKHHTNIQDNTDFEYIPEDGRHSLLRSIQKTREALDAAYTGFDNATEQELIDSYIYEINALQKRYQYLLEQLQAIPYVQVSDQHTTIHTLVSHVFG